MASGGKIYTLLSHKNIVRRFGDFLACSMGEVRHHSCSSLNASQNCEGLICNAFIVSGPEREVSRLWGPETPF